MDYFIFLKDSWSVRDLLSQRQSAAATSHSTTPQSQSYKYLLYYTSGARSSSTKCPKFYDSESEDHTPHTEPDPRDDRASEANTSPALPQGNIEESGRGGKQVGQFCLNMKTRFCGGKKKHVVTFFTKWLSLNLIFVARSYDGLHCQQPRQIHLETICKEQS